MTTRSGLLMIVAALSAGCATTMPAYYGQQGTEQARSVVVLPVLNHTGLSAPAELLQGTAPPALVALGYYTFPTNMSNDVLADQGITDASEAHSLDPAKLRKTFGCDAALYLTVNRWRDGARLFYSFTSVDVGYELKSCKTGEQLWQANLVADVGQTEDDGGDCNESDWGALCILWFAGSLLVELLDEDLAPHFVVARKTHQLALLRTPLPQGPYRFKSESKYQVEMQRYRDGAQQALQTARQLALQIKEVDLAELPESTYDSLGTAEGISCVSPGPGHPDAARSKLKQNAVDLGANAVANVNCGESQKISWRHNCLGYFFCRAEALRVDEAAAQAVQ